MLRLALERDYYKLWSTDPGRAITLRVCASQRQTWRIVPMHSAAATIYCPNYFCQALNPESHKFCQQCRTRLPKRYLWIVGAGAELLSAGELLDQRYFLKQRQIALDTKPGLAPESPGKISEYLEPYLRLSSFQLHVPQVYGVVQASPELGGSTLLLLEQAPIVSEETAEQVPSLQAGSLMPAIVDVWSQVPAIRQLNWLWQLAHLWQPLQSERVASTLLNPELIRVEGSLVRLLELRRDQGKLLELSALGHLWQQWQPYTHSDIASFLAQLCQQILQGQVQNSEQLVAMLDRALAICGQAQERQIQIATQTDQGPTRQRNEDACYPSSGSLVTIRSTAVSSAGTLPELALPIVIICDGIGGHEGGNVASNLAITTVEHQLKQWLLPAYLEPSTVISHLEQTALAANDVINQRNDSEHRQERQRMGTTLVMALAQAHELYLTHVGDSRAYRITRSGCHQVTLDDDLASREVRLGYALYRDALQHPGSGSLIQALGMNASSLLHPTVQRFVLDEDCLFLLCSDGLSDHDRVEEHWQTELLPVLEGTIDLATASQRLIAIANSQNGHDNVTIGLVHCQVRFTDHGVPPAALDETLTASPVATPTNLATQALASNSVSTSGTTRILQPPRRSPNVFLVLISLLMLGMLGSSLAYLFVPEFRSWVSTVRGLTSPSPEPVSTIPSVIPSPSATDAPPLPSPLSSISVGSLVQVSVRAAAQLEQPPLLALLTQPEPPDPLKRSAIAQLPVGSVLKVFTRRKVADQVNWLQLTVCSVPPKAGTVSQVAKPGDIGWIREDDLAGWVTQDLRLNATEVGACAPGASPTPSPRPSQSGRVDSAGQERTP